MNTKPHTNSTGGPKGPFNTPRYLSVTETAQLVRRALARHFPGFTFSARSKRYAGGASIRVHWTDGPTAGEVDKVIQPYAGARFDGMIDLKSHVSHWLTTDGEAYLAHDPGTEGSRGIYPAVSRIAPHDDAEQVHFGADYVFAERQFSEGFLRPVAAYVACKYGCKETPEVVQYQYSGAYVRSNVYPISNSTDTLADLVHRYARKASEVRP